jgi:hypothetical protein
LAQLTAQIDLVLDQVKGGRHLNWLAKAHLVCEQRSVSGREKFSPSLILTKSAQTL